VSVIAKGPRMAHGLWVVHQAFANKRRRDPTWDWCEGESGKSLSVDFYLGWRCTYPHIIRQCANRYCRRYHLKTVRQYNRVIDRICDRFEAMWNTRNAALLPFKGSARLVFGDDKKCDVDTQFRQWDVFDRRDRIREIRRRKEIVRKEAIDRWNAQIVHSLDETQNELRIIRRAIRNAQSALRSANA